VASRLGNVGLVNDTATPIERPQKVKVSSHDIYTRSRSIPSLRFEDQKLTSFGGIVIFQQLFAKLELRERLGACVRHMEGSGSYMLSTVVQVLIVHVLLGYRRLRDVAFYENDPMVKRLLGLLRLPVQSTLSRLLRLFDSESVSKLRALVRDLIIERLAASG